jgi:excisionase family DNA binding protein
MTTFDSNTPLIGSENNSRSPQTSIETDVKLLQNYPDVMQVKEVAAVLRLGKNKTYALIKDGTIPHIKLGRKVLVPKKKVLALLDNLCYNNIVTADNLTVERS